MLTEHFTLKEFAISRAFPELAQKTCFSQAQKERIRFACSAILEPLRAHFASPVIITSGKRTPELNRMVGGHPLSNHLFMADQGAVDIVIPHITPISIADWLIRNVTTRLVIAYSKPAFVHISFPDSRGIINKLQIQS